jgi:hypothetical protein
MLNKKYQVEVDEILLQKYMTGGFIDLTDVLSVNEQSVLRWHMHLHNVKIH